MTDKSKQQARPPEEQGLRIKQVKVVGPTGEMYSGKTFVGVGSPIKGQTAEFEICEFGVLRVKVTLGADKGRIFLIPPTRWEAEEMV